MFFSRRYYLVSKTLLVVGEGSLKSHSEEGRSFSATCKNKYFFSLTEWFLEIHSSTFCYNNFNLRFFGQNTYEKNHVCIKNNLV